VQNPPAVSHAGPLARWLPALAILPAICFAARFSAKYPLRKNKTAHYLLRRQPIRLNIPSEK